LQVSSVQNGSVVVITVRGPMVADELHLLDVEVRECLDAAFNKIVLDLKEVPFIDSAGLERIQDVVVDLGRRGGDLYVASLNDVCLDIFLATQMNSFVQIADTTEAAVRSLS
jgi:anti-anti-sigma factor